MNSNTAINKSRCHSRLVQSAWYTFKLAVLLTGTCMLSISQVTANNGSGELLPQPPRTEHILSSEISGNNVTFDLNQRNTFLQLESIKAQAEAAGITFTYRVIEFRNRVTELQLNMQVGARQQQISVHGRYRMTIGWILGADGKAVRLYEGEP